MKILLRVHCGGFASRVGPAHDCARTTTIPAETEIGDRPRALAMKRWVETIQTPRGSPVELGPLCEACARKALGDPLIDEAFRRLLPS